MPPVIIDVKTLYGETAKVGALADYERLALELAGEGKEVVLTGQGPIWLYLRLAHRLHGHAKRLSYRSPALTEGDIVIFDHDAY
jgi:hypothetical protein